MTLTAPLPGSGRLGFVPGKVVISRSIFSRGAECQKEVRVGTELKDRFIVSQLLGDGGFGIVWQATDKQAGREVAIKRMKSLGGGERESLLAEARQINALLKSFPDQHYRLLSCLLATQILACDKVHVCDRVCVTRSPWFWPLVRWHSSPSFWAFRVLEYHAPQTESLTSQLRLRAPPMGNPIFRECGDGSTSESHAGPSVETPKFPGSLSISPRR